MGGLCNLKLFTLVIKEISLAIFACIPSFYSPMNIYTFSSLVLNVSSFFGEFDILWFLKCLYFIAGYRFNVTSIETQAIPFAFYFDICNKLIPNQV